LARATVTDTSMVPTRMTSNARTSIAAIAGSLTTASHSLMRYHSRTTCSTRCLPRAASLMWADMPLIGADMADHAEHGGDADQQQDHGHDEHERCGEAGLGVNQVLRFHVRAQPAQARHEHQVIDDPHEQHADAEQHQ